MRRFAAWAVLFTILLPAGTRASDTEGLEYRASLDVPLTLAGLAGTFAPPLLTDPAQPWTCRWCERDADGATRLNGLDAGARRRWLWSDTGKAHQWSNVALAASFVAPASALVAARGSFGDGFGQELLLVAESSALTLGLAQGTKYLFRRERPWAQFATSPGRERIASRESMQSFVSGHTALSFAMAVTTGSIASLTGQQDEWVWASGLTFAAATGYLRVAADRHYLTDVVAGAALGATVGWVVPRLFDRRPEAAAPQDPQPLGRRVRTPVPLFSAAFRAGRAGPSSGVFVSGGLQGGGPYVSGTWRF